MGDSLSYLILSWYQLSMFYKIQQGLVGISLPSEECSLTRAFELPMHSLSVIFNPIVTSINIRSTQVNKNKLPVTTGIFPFTNGIMLTISSTIRLL